MKEERRGEDSTGQDGADVGDEAKGSGEEREQGQG